MAAAVLLGGGPLVVSQAATSGVLVAALPSTNAIPTRLVDALVGGAVGLAVLVAVPRNPLTTVRRTTRPLFGELAGVLEAIAPGLPLSVRGLAEGVRDLERELDEGRGAALPVSVIVGQVRSTAVDLLRALGIERLETVEHVRAAARRLSAEERGGVAGAGR